MNKRLMIIFSILFILAVIIGSFAFFYKKPGETVPQKDGVVNKPTDNKDIPKIDLSNYVPSKEVSTWKTYKNDELGIELKYPSEYESNFSSGWMNSASVSFYSKSNNMNEGGEINVGREFISQENCSFFFCDQVKNILLINNVSWDYFGKQTYGDAGDFFVYNAVYGVVHNGYRYYIFFQNESRDRDFLSTFKFTK